MAMTVFDPRLEAVKEEKEDALKQTDAVYKDLLNQTQSTYDKLIDVEKDYAEAQTQAQQEETELAVEELQQKQADAQEDYAEERSEAYTDYQKQVNDYAPAAEAMADKGLSGSGYSESAKVSMFNAYQNRVAVARDGFRQAIREYDLAIREARQLNSAALAKIAYDTLKRQSELALKAVTQYAQLQMKWTDRRYDQQTQYRKWEDALQEEIWESTPPRAAEPPKQGNNKPVLEQRVDGV